MTHGTEKLSIGKSPYAFSFLSRELRDIHRFDECTGPQAGTA